MSTMKFTEKRVMSPDRLRALCIERNWYTRGNNEEYSRLLDRVTDCCGCAENLTTDKLVEIAIDIYDHSEITYYTIEAILFELSRACYSYFDVVA